MKAEEEMSVIKINAITVPKDLGDEVARRFAGRIKAVDGREGFQGFELMRPTDDRKPGWWLPDGTLRKIFFHGSNPQILQKATVPQWKPQKSILNLCL